MSIITKTYISVSKHMANPGSFKRLNNNLRFNEHYSIRPAQNSFGNKSMSNVNDFLTFTNTMELLQMYHKYEKYERPTSRTMRAENLSAPWSSSFGLSRI